MYRLTCLIVLLIALVGLAPAEEDRPNVLFIAIDDLRPELGCYGVEGIHSPNIDRLAGEGVRFDAAHCQLAVCNPSRVSLLTGLRPDSTRVWTLDTRFRHTIPDAVTLPQFFKEQGYSTVGFGKIFHNPWPDNVSWSEPHAWPRGSQLWSKRAREDLAAFKEELRKKGTPQSKIDRLRAAATEIVDLDDDRHIDGGIAVQAIEAMRRLAKEERPFFVGAGFIRPHLPFVVPRKYWDLYERDEIPLAESPSLPRGAPGYAMNTMYELRDYHDYLDTPDPRSGSLSEAQQRELKHGYWASVSFIDALVGRLLDELERLELTENTIVVLWSDHGWKLGEMNSWCKQTNYEIDTRVPLIIRYPRARGNSGVSESLVELVDVFPTLCDLAGLAVPKKLEGTSLRPVLDDPGARVKDAAVSQFFRRTGKGELMGYALRTDRWRYVEWIHCKTGETVGRELYDHDVDAGETENVAGREGNEEILARLGEALRVANGGLRPGVPERKVSSRPRPSILIRNESSVELTVSWLPGDGRKPRQVGVIQPGGSLPQGTTKGHRFRITGDGINRVITVTKEKETITLEKPALKRGRESPNLVVIVGDDWSWPHASILGDTTVKTPTFDRIAREGVLFENAFTPAPSCTPSRHAILSGQYHWRLGEGVNLGGSLPREVEVYPELLSNVGYHTGFSRKGTSPSQHRFRGSDPLGERFDDFDTFLDKREPGVPFSYWYGAGEPHRPYDWGASRKRGMDLKGIDVPGFLPDNQTTRTDLGDYYLRVEKLDRLSGEILDRLEQDGELENTIVVMTSDNGMPFPRAKATLYDSGTRVPLAIRWGKKIPGGSRVTDFVSLTDLAPTILEALGFPIPSGMTGRSLLPGLLSGKSGRIEEERDHVLTGMERHVYPNPSRAIRTGDHLYIRNFVPELWPTGKPSGEEPIFDFKKTPWPTQPGAFSHNIDPGPTKQMMRTGDFPENRQAFEGRQAEELYDLKEDPEQLTNLLETADRNLPAELKTIRKELSDRLTRGLRQSGDPLFEKPEHVTFRMHGWTIHLSDRLWSEQGAATRHMLAMLDGQLARVARVVPKVALAKIREIPIWINPTYPGSRGSAEYHPGAGWLRDNGRNPEMVRSVEISNVPIFPFENRRMPYLLLHELAHGYHHRELPEGYGNPEIKEAYERARDSGGYDEVDRFNGRKTVRDKAYAMTNPMEFFAESSEAYFGKNDFFPFDRKELREHDPQTLELIRRLWGAPADNP